MDGPQGEAQELNINKLDGDEKDMDQERNLDHKKKEKQDQRRWSLADIDRDGEQLREERWKL